MIPGNSRIITCPYCGEEKEIMSLVSGNTFGAKLWSDNKRIAPMLPEISLVQKCPKCGKYYVTSRQEVKYAEEGWSSEKGLLSFPEMKDAYAQISSEGFENEKEEANIRMMLHHAFNDFYYRNNTDKDIIVSEEDARIFKENGKWLIENLIYDNVLKAEFYREIGDFTRASMTLEKAEAKDEFLKSIVDKIKMHIENKDTRVFLLNR